MEDGFSLALDLSLEKSCRGVRVRKHRRVGLLDPHKFHVTRPCSLNLLLGGPQDHMRMPISQVRFLRSP